jgi:hypothetical protein
MSVEDRLNRLERYLAGGGQPFVAWDNLFARSPEDLVPDGSGIDWPALFAPPPLSRPDPLMEALAQRGLLNEVSETKGSEYASQATHEVADASE